MGYVIFGAGAIGGVIGARLHAAGRDVTLVARGAHLEAMRHKGLELHTPDGIENHRIPCADSPGALHLADGDVVLLAVKSQDTAAALAQLEAVAPPGITVVCAQNGVVNETAALRRFASVQAMCVILPAEFLSPGVVVQHAAPLPGVLDLGRYPEGVDETSEAVRHDVAAAGFESEVDPHVMRRKYRKLLMNLGNAVDAVCGLSAWGSDIATMAREEGEACLAAAGIDVQPEDEERARRDGMTIRPVEGHPRVGSSSLQSLERGTGSIEADWLNGEIVLLGRLHGVPTPVNDLLRRTANRFAREGGRPGDVTADDLLDQLAGTHR